MGARNHLSEGARREASQFGSGVFEKKKVLCRRVLLRPFLILPLSLSPLSLLPSPRNRRPVSLFFLVVISDCTFFLSLSPCLRVRQKNSKRNSKKRGKKLIETPLYLSLSLSHQNCSTKKTRRGNQMTARASIAASLLFLSLWVVTDLLLCLLRVG